MRWRTCNNNRRRLREKVKIKVTLLGARGQRRVRSFLPGPMNWTVPWTIGPAEEIRFNMEIKRRA